MAFHREMTARDLEVGGADALKPLTRRDAFGSSALAADRARDVGSGNGWKTAGGSPVRDAPAGEGPRLHHRGGADAGPGYRRQQHFSSPSTRPACEDCQSNGPIACCFSAFATRASDSWRYHGASSIRPGTAAHVCQPAASPTRSFRSVTTGPPDREAGTYISSTAFHLLGEPPALGRDFLPSDDRPARRRSSSSRTGSGIDDTRPTLTIGAPSRVDGRAATVIGVMRDPFQFPGFACIWLRRWRSCRPALKLHER